jgi:hypothetical protein
VYPQLPSRNYRSFVAKPTYFCEFDDIANIDRPYALTDEIMLANALKTIRCDTATQPQGTISLDFQCSREGTTGKLRGHAIAVMHSCKLGAASDRWMVVYTGKGRFFHVDARRAFNRAPWYGEQLFGAEQRRRFLRDLNDRFHSANEFATWAIAEDMPRIEQDLNQSPIEDPRTLQVKGHA